MSHVTLTQGVAAAALAIPDLAALIFSAYCSGIRVDFQCRFSFMLALFAFHGGTKPSLSKPVNDWFPR